MTIGPLLPCTLLAATATLASCQYVTDRSLDFLDQYRVAIGVGSVVGARAKAGGMVETGLMVGIKPNAAALGWKYGSARYFHEADERVDGDQAQIVMTTSFVGLRYEEGSYEGARNSAAILPALFTWADASPVDYAWQVPEEGSLYDDRHWIWSTESFGGNRYAQIHAFDVELEVGFLGYVDLGYSPGEFLDFLLGLFTIDIARDDGRL